MNEVREPSQRLLIVHLDQQAGDAEKGVAWQCRKYEGRFETVHNVCLYGAAEPQGQGRTTYRSVGSANHRRDLLAAPWRLWREARRDRPDVIVGYDVYFLWWTTSLVRLVLRVPVVLVPICLPEEVRAAGGASVSGLPRWLERVALWLSFSSARSILACEMLPSYSRWIRSLGPGRRRLTAVRPAFAEAFLGLPFYEAVATLRPTAHRSPSELLCVSRIHPEKLVLDLVEVMAAVRAAVPDAHLTLVGDGPQRAELERRAAEAGLGGAITVVPRVANEELAPYYLSASVYVSPYTGMSLREAAFCGLPVVAYDTDAVDFLTNGEDALLVPVRDRVALADAVVVLLQDEARRLQLADGARQLAERLWGPQHLAGALESSFAGVVGRAPTREVAA